MISNLLKKSIALSLTSLLTLTALSQSTKLEKKRFGYFTDGIETKKLHKFEAYFQTSEEKQIAFNKFNKTRKAQKVINFISLGLGAASLGLAGSSNSDTFTETFNKLQVAGTGLFLSGVLALIGNAIAIPVKIKHKKKLLNNNDSFGKLPVKIEETALVFKVNPNGVGITYTF